MLDLTSTSRNLDTDAKKQKFLPLRWAQMGRGQHNVKAG